MDKRSRLVEPSARARDSGFSLIEVLIATTLLTAIFGAAFGVVVSGSKTVEVGIAETELQSRVRLVLDRLAADLRSARIETSIDPLNLRYRKLHGSYEDGFVGFDFDAAEILWNDIPISRYFWAPALDDPTNGVDDNDNGLIDEGTVSRETGGTTVVVTRHVPIDGFAFRDVGPKKLELTLALERHGRDGETIRVQGSTTVFLRND